MLIRFPRARGALLALLAATWLASPALADHAAPTDVGGAGATLNLIGPQTLGRGGVSLGARLLLNRPDRRSDSELEALAARHVHAHDSDHSLNLAFGAAYGVSDRLILSVELPFVHHDDLRAGEHSHSAGAALNEVVPLGSVTGVGDPSLLAKYRLADSSELRLALIGGLELPLGDTHRRDGQGERLATEHQPGSGSWDPLVGAAVGTCVGRLNLIASGLYQFAGKGAQDTRLGDRARGGIALSFPLRGPRAIPAAAGEHHHAHADHHAEGGDGEDHHHGTATAPAPQPQPSWDALVELTGEWEGRQRIAGEVDADSGGKAVWLTPGVRFTAANGYSLGAGIGLPLWQDIRPSHPDNRFRLTLAVGRAF